MGLGGRLGGTWARHGAHPVRLHIRTLAEIDRRLVGLVVGGGNDIDPAVYGGDVSFSPKTDPARDAYELRALELAEERNLPVLGICRGAQLMNVHRGGTLIADLSRHRVLTSNRGTLLARKVVDITAGSELASWLGKARTKVNSLHHQAVERTGAGLRVTAKDRDDIVQGIESTSGPPWVGVQWHPEYLPHRKDQCRLFGEFVSACRDSQRVGNCAGG